VKKNVSLSLFGALMLLLLAGTGIAYASSWKFKASFDRPILPQPASLSASATAEGCENNPGPFITLSGDLTLGGINARLIFRNNVKGTHEHQEQIQVTVEILPNGEAITFAKQPPLEGVGGNPWIYLQFTDGNGKALSGEILLGRCVQMSK